MAWRMAFVVERRFFSSRATAGAAGSFPATGTGACSWPPRAFQAPRPWRATRALREALFVDDRPIHSPLTGSSAAGASLAAEVHSRPCGAPPAARAAVDFGPRT